MNFLNKLERKVGKHAIPNLSKYLILGYVIGYVIEFMDTYLGTSIINLITLNPYLILHGQVWRLITWIIVPPSGFSLWTIIMLYFYYSVGSSLERTWGTFYYNVYIFLGMIFTLLGSFLIMAISYIPVFTTTYTWLSFYGASTYFQIVAQYFSTYYVNMSIFLGFAATFPEVRVLLMFIVPIKVKWLGVAYGVLLIWEMISSNIIGRIVIAASLLNFVVFFLMTRRGIRRLSPHEVKRRHDFNREVKKARPMSVSKHKCAVCGRNSIDNPDAEFRFCSKCNGNYEYCQEHLFTHTHVK